jgi:ABC-type sugar transport system substrate-binding protein
MIRFATNLGLATFMACALATSVAGAAADEGKCTIATKGDNAVVQACNKGGRAEAKKVMKDMVKQAKANGKKFTCDGCHKDLDNYELSKSATDEFKKLEAAVKGK